MGNKLIVFAAVALVLASFAGCADSATCSPNEILTDGLCVPVPPAATGGAGETPGSAGQGGGGGRVDVDPGTGGAAQGGEGGQTGELGGQGGGK